MTIDTRVFSTETDEAFEHTVGVRTTDGRQDSYSSDIGPTLTRFAADVARGANVPRRINLKSRRYTMGGLGFSLPGFEMKGRAGTEIECTGTTPVTVVDPLNSARTITTACLGLLIYANPRLPFVPRRICFKNIHFIGLTGTALVPGHYTMLSIEGQEVEFWNCTFSNEVSVLYDATALSPYKGLSKRNILSLGLVHAGADRWMSPNPGTARGTSHLTVIGCKFDGEPLDETSGASATLIAVIARKVAQVLWEGNLFGHTINPAQRMVSDFILTGNPANNDSFFVVGYDAVTEQETLASYTFKTSANPAVPTEVQIAATHPLTILNVALRVSAQAGANNVRVIPPSRYLAPDTDGVVGVARFEMTPFYPVNQFVGESVDAGNVISVRAISGRNLRTHYWKYGLVLEDSYPHSIGSTVVGTDNFANAVCLNVATQAHLDFTQNIWSEAGHTSYHGWVAHTCAFGEAFFDTRSLAFCEWDRSNTLGQMGLGLTGAKVSLCKVHNGTHQAWGLEAASNVLEGKTFTVIDSNGASKTFEFDNNGSVGGGNVVVTMGANEQASMRAARAAIRAQADAHALQVFVSDANSGSPSAVTVTFWAFVRHVGTGSITVSGAPLSAADASIPYQPFGFSWDAAVHWNGTLDGYSMPIVWAENCHGSVVIDGVTSHIRAIDPRVRGFASHRIFFADVGTDTLLPDSTSNPAWRCIVTNNGQPAVTFELDSNAHVVENATLKRVDVSAVAGSARIVSYAKILADTINTWSGTLVLGVVANDLAGGFFSWSATAQGDHVAVYVTSTVVGVNASLLALSGASANSSLNDVSTLGQLHNPATSDGAAAADYEYNAVVIKDCRQVTIGMQFGPFSSIRTLPGSTVEAFNDAISVTPQFNYGMRGAFVGDIRPIYLYKSSANITSKVTLRAIDAKGPWGVAGATAITARDKRRLYNVGGAFGINDPTVLDCANVVDQNVVK